jgi:hypothetical protein
MEKGSDPNGANLRADFKIISSLWLACVAKREIAARSGRGIGRERRGGRPAAQVSYPTSI